MYKPDSELPEERISKTRRKREMHALQDLGEELAALSAEQLAKMPLPDELREALALTRGIARSKHEARRRQLQYVGRLMRDLDPVPIREALDALHGRSHRAAAQLHRIERLRDRLLEDEGVLSEIAGTHPAADLQQLRALRRNALSEREQARPPRAYRELFKALRSLEAATSLQEDGQDREE